MAVTAFERRVNQKRGALKAVRKDILNRKELLIITFPPKPIFPY
jgi:hypothetical protein